MSILLKSSSFLFEWYVAFKLIPVAANTLSTDQARIRYSAFVFVRKMQRVCVDQQLRLVLNAEVQLTCH